MMESLQLDAFGVASFGNDPSSNGILFLALSLAVVAVVVVTYLRSHLRFVDRDEQLIIDGLVEQTIVAGPKVTILPFFYKSCRVEKTLSLGVMEYCIVKNTLTGDKRNVVGPAMVLLQPYDDILLDQQYNARARNAISLKANEYVRLLDRTTGTVRVERGEQGCVVPLVNEILVDGNKKKAMDLKVFEYVKIQDKKTGVVRTERGEKLAFLGPHEEFLGSKQNAIEVDDETAVLVRNKRSGQQHLVTKKMLFVPADDEEVLEVRPLIKLAEYEACIVRDKHGKDIFHYGRDSQQRSFFLLPYCEVLTLKWSRGRRRERRDLAIQKLDLRPMFMSFEFLTRTRDNVELLLEGSFFWEIENLENMIKYTNDTTGDISNRARSRFIELVSKVDLKTFMSEFNQIAKEVHKSDDSEFYTKRGVKIHSLEVTGYRCTDKRTAETLALIIQETTNRINRLQAQESENEVELKQIRGDIEEETARSELLEVQTKNSNARSKMEGLAEAERVKSFLTELQTSFPELGPKQVIDLWKTLRKEDALRAVAKSNAKLYFTPAEANLSIETHEHVKEPSWVGASESHED